MLICNQSLLFSSHTAYAVIPHLSMALCLLTTILTLTIIEPLM